MKRWGTLVSLRIGRLAAAVAVVASALSPQLDSVAAAAGACPVECSLWDETIVPGTPATADSAAVELGVRFSTDVAGWVTGIRFFKGLGNDGPHTGSLWDAAGNQMAAASTVSETATGWQQADFASPIPVLAGVAYVASYFAPHGHYAYDGGYFASTGVDRGPLHAPPDGAGAGNGLFRYGGGFPDSTALSANYWVDVVFSTGPVVTGFTPSSGPVGAEVDLTGVGLTGLQSVTLGGSPVQIVSSGPTVIRVRLNSWNSTGRFAVTVAGGRTGLSKQVFSVRAPVACPGTCTVWEPDDVPGTVATSDSSAVELGMRFRTESPGWATGVRFFKGPGNIGTHTGSVWSASGSRLATGTFSGETAAGWQQLDFSTPVALSANTTYVVSYLAPNGHYAYDAPFFSETIDRPPLRVLRDGYDGPNGVFRYGGGFPSESASLANYWVDVAFSTGATADGFSPGAGSPQSVVTITGRALNLVRAVTLNGAPVTVVSRSAGQVVVRLNSWNTSGQFVLQVLGGGTVVVPGTFTVVQ